MLNNMMGATSNNITFAQLLLSPTREYGEQYIRPYELNVDQESLNTFTNMFHHDSRYGNNGISVEGVAQTLPNMIRKADAPIGSASIINGWQTERLRFILEVVTMEGDNQELVSYVQGYSEYYDPTYTGKIDDNMLFYINSIVNVRRSINPATNTIVARVVQNFNIIYNHDNTITIDETNDLVTARPKDVVDGLSNIISPVYMDDNVQVIDSRNNYHLDMKTTHRKHNLAVNHLTDTINKINMSKQGAEITNDYTDIYRNTVANLNSADSLRTPFLSALFRLSESAAETTFTLNTLMYLDPGIENVTTLINKDKSRATTNTIMDTNDSESMHHVNIETNIASTVADSVTSLLAENLLSEISFTITNLTIDSEPVIAPGVVESMVTGIDIPIYAERFFAKFTQTVMPVITSAGLIGLDIYVTADLLGETVVAVGINGAPNVVYRLPTFCDSLYSPIITNSYGMSNMVEGYQEIIHNTL